MPIKFLWKQPDNPKLFGGSIGSQDAELDAKIIDGLKMRASLNRFARQLAEQYKGYGRKPTQYSDGSRVIGVELHAISFTLITEPIKR